MADAVSLTPPVSAKKGWETLGLLSRYQWFVFLMASLAWTADCMDQQLFTAARVQAIQAVLTNQHGAEFVKSSEGAALAKSWAAGATAAFLVGWAVGGFIFGVMGDRSGRVKTLITTVLLYSVFTGLSAFSTSVYDFTLYRFLTGLGVGGVFGVAVALLAEEMPDQARPYTLGLLQALSAVGNVTAALITMLFGYLVSQGTFVGAKWQPWQIMFLVGVAPAALVLLMRGRLHEPAKWVERVKAGKAEGIKAGSFGELLTDKRWAKNAWLGLLLAFAGVVGLWGIGFFSVDLNQSIFRKVVGEHAQQLGLDEATKAYFIPGMTMVWSGVGLFTLQIGAFWGMISFSWLAQAIGRKPAFFISFLGALASTVAVFGFVSEVWHLFTLVPLMGFFQLSLFGGYAIYFPELFPTHLRSTGTSFCYNFGRLIAATGPLLLGYLTANVFTKENGYQEGMRQAGMVMSSVFLLGVLVLPWLPETKGKPLPE